MCFFKYLSKIKKILEGTDLRVKYNYQQLTYMLYNLVQRNKNSVLISQYLIEIISTANEVVVSAGRSGYGINILITSRQLTRSKATLRLLRER